MNKQHMENSCSRESTLGCQTATRKYSPQGMFRERGNWKRLTDLFLFKIKQQSISSHTSLRYFCHKTSSQAQFVNPIFSRNFYFLKRNQFLFFQKNGVVKLALTFVNINPPHPARMVECYKSPHTRGCLGRVNLPVVPK